MIVDTEDTPFPLFSMMAIVDGLQVNMINNIYLRHGQTGPILMDLRPLMQVQHLGLHSSLLTIPDGSMPPGVDHAIRTGNAYVSVEFPTSIHPDGAIVGAVSLVPAPQALPGDYNDDGRVDAADFVDWRKTDGTAHGYATWRTNFGSTLGGNGLASHLNDGTHVIPEPTSVFLVGLATVCIVRDVRRRTRR